MTAFKLFVPGRPVPQGSKSAFVSKSTGKPIVVDKDVRLPQWRSKITAAAIDIQAEYMQTQPTTKYPLDGSIGARVTFVFNRPQWHYLPANRKRAVPELRSDAPWYVPVMPDVDKLLRAVFDAVTDAQVIHDDAQIVWVQTSKKYVDPPGLPAQGVYIEIGVMR